MFSPAHMIAVFFTKSSHVASVLLQETINTELHVNICLPKVFKAWSFRHPHSGIRGHDNAGVHTASTILDYLEANRVQLITQTPYYPGLAPCDFSLFPQGKQQLKGKQV